MKKSDIVKRLLLRVRRGEAPHGYSPEAIDLATQLVKLQDHIAQRMLARSPRYEQIDGQPSDLLEPFHPEDKLLDEGCDLIESRLAALDFQCNCAELLEAMEATIASSPPECPVHGRHVMHEHVLD